MVPVQPILIQPIWLGRIPQLQSVLPGLLWPKLEFLLLSQLKLLCADLPNSSHTIHHQLILQLTYSNLIVDRTILVPSLQPRLGISMLEMDYFTHNVPGAESYPTAYSDGRPNVIFEDNEY